MPTLDKNQTPEPDPVWTDVEYIRHQRRNFGERDYLGEMANAVVPNLLLMSPVEKLRFKSRLRARILG